MEHTAYKLEQFAKFTINNLLKPYPDSNFARRAIVETEKPIEGDTWFWADDNAKVLELLSNPQIWRAYPVEVNEIINFLLAMFEGPLIFRRAGARRLVPASAAANCTAFTHSLMNISADPGKGVVTLGMRFHDDRTSRNAILTGNYLRFTFQGRCHTIDVEEGIFNSGTEFANGSVCFWWSSKIEVADVGHKQRTTRVGTVKYSCIIKDSSMFVDLKAELDIAPGFEISDVVLTFGLDDLSHNNNNIRYEAISVVVPGHQTKILEANAKARFEVDAPGCSYWSVFQRSQMAGFAVAIHSLPIGECPISLLRVNCQEDDAKFHWIVSEYEFPGPQRGRLIAQERKLITSGGFYSAAETYAEILTRQSRLADERTCPIDFSVSYDYGAEVHSLARCFRTLSSENLSAHSAADEALKTRLKDAVSSLFQVYEDHFLRSARDRDSEIFSRSLSFVALAYAEMFEATGERRYSEALRNSCELICRFEKQNAAVDGAVQSGFVMGTQHDALPYVDCHAACLLTLTRATEILDEKAWLASIDRGLAAFCIDTVLINFCGRKKQDVVGVDFLDHEGQRHTLETFWNFKSGLCLRLFNALRKTKHQGLRAVWAKHTERLSVLEMLMRDRITRSLRERETGTEILTSMLSAETNSETQPWVALGLCGER